MNKSLIKIPLINLTVATLLGAFLRFIPVQSVEGINYKFFLHAHSHVAFLGWAYIAFFLTLLFAFVPADKPLKKTYKIQFWATQVSVTGMLVTFPLQGYALLSIIFSTAQILLSYIFFITIIRDVPNKLKTSIAYKFIFTAMIFMILSSLGPWFLGIIMAKGWSNTYWYPLTIYFYLHFQYNGWFTFAIFGLLLQLFEDKGKVFPNSHSKIFFYLMTVSCVSGYFLSTLWIKPPGIIYVLSFIAVFLQVIALFYLFKVIKKATLIRLNELPQWIKILAVISIASFIIKISLQFFSVFIPMFEIRTLIIAYLHLTLIGFVSFFLLAYLQNTGFITMNSWFKKGTIFAVIGFILSEILLFTQGGLSWAGKGMIPGYYFLLFAVSLLMPIGYILLTLSQFIKSKK